eukprot:2645155-Rhodomonas_salina.1
MATPPPVVFALFIEKLSLDRVTPLLPAYIPPPDGALFMENTLPDEVTLLIATAATPPPTPEAVLLLSVSVVRMMELLVP